MQKRILVTGAAGFIGFHVTKALLTSGQHVVAIDNFNDYYPVTLKEDRASELKKLGLIVTKKDICNRAELLQIIEEEQISHIVHLAAQAGVRYSFAHPEAYIKANVEGFLNILEAARAFPGVRLVYASSSSVYGSNEKIPFAVSDPTDSQTNVYGVTKKTNELLASSYHHLFKVPSIGLRFFTVYGPWGRPDMAYFSFTKAILEGQSIEVYNQGRSKRDFTYIDDVVSAIIASLACKENLGLFNIGNTNPESVNYLIELIEKKTKMSAKKVLLPLQLGEIVDTFADIGSSKETLGFLPKITLAEGIDRFVDWYRSYFRI
jgi:UDP-glucuronate 4-epimerase